MNIDKIICVLGLILISSCSIKRPVTIENEKIESNVICSLELNQETFLVGESLTLYFVVENRTEEIIYINNLPWGYYMDGKNRTGGFNIEVETENHETIEPLDGIDMKSGKYGITKIEPTEKLKIRVHDIFRYRITRNEGNYIVTIGKELDVYMNKQEDANRDSNTSQDYKRCLRIKKTENININVLNI